MKLNLRSGALMKSGNCLTDQHTLTSKRSNRTLEIPIHGISYLVKKSNPVFLSLLLIFSFIGLSSTAQVQLVQWSGLSGTNGNEYNPTPVIVLGGLKAWDMRMSSGWTEATTPARQSVNFTDNYMDKATTVKGARNTWVLADKTEGAGSAYNDSNFVEYKVQAVGGAFNVGLVQMSAIFNGVAKDSSGRMAVYYSIDDDSLSFANPMNLGTANLALHNGGVETSGSTIADPIHLQSAGTLAQTRITTHAGDYSFTPGVTVNTGQYLTLRVYAWSASAPTKALAIRNVVFSNSTPWPSQQLSPTMATLVQPTSVNLSSEVVTDGGYTVTQTGFAYTTDELFVRYTPGVNDRVAAVNGSSTTGSFTGTFTGLKPATTYWARSYAITENGTSYGKVVQFTTPDSITAKPTVTTTAATNIGAAAAVSGGNTSANGGGQIVTTGLLYSKTLMDAVTLVRGAGDSIITASPGLGAFVSNLSGLEAGTIYYIRAFAANSDSTGYGAVLSFTTKLVDIVTTTASNISATKATTGGTITPNGGGTIDSSGVVYATTQNPEVMVGAMYTKDNATTGSFVSNLSGLTPNTTYYVRAYAAIGGVITYGDQKSFKTSVAPQLVQWSGLSGTNGNEYNPTPVIVLGGLKAWDMRMSSGWTEATTPARQSVNFTDNYMDKATTVKGARNTWVLADKTEGAGSAYNDSNFVEYKVQAVGGAFNVGLVQMSAIFNGVAKDSSGRMAVYYSIDDDSLSFANPMNLGIANLALHNGGVETSGSTIADPIHLQSAGTLAQTRITTHAGDYSFTPGVTVNTGQYLTLRVYAWSASAPTKALAIRNVVFSNSTPWPSQQLSPTMATLVQPTSVNLSSEVVTDGGYTVTQTGFAYTTDELFVRYTPGVNDRVAAVNGSSTTGSFTGTFTGLKPATTYWARSYAITENGTSYGKVVQFTTPDSITAKPTVTTTAATNIGAAAAVSGGNTSANGGGQIVTTGLLYSKTLMDAVTLVRGAGDSIITASPGLGAFVSNLSGLEAGTIYYIRAFAANSDSTGYGAVLSFTTKLVDIVTTTASNISATKATTGGTITPNGGGTIDSSGVVYATTQNPEVMVGAMYTKDNATTGSFVSNLSGLTPNTTYYVRAYAAIGGVITYGDQKSFKTSVAPQLVQWSGLSGTNGNEYNPTPVIVLGGLKAWDMRMSSGWTEATTPARQSVNFTDNYMDKATTVKGARNTWVLADKTEGAGSAYNDSNFVEYKVQAVGGAFNVGLVQMSAIFNGVAKDSSGRMAVYYSIDDDSLSFANPMNLGTANLALHNGGVETSGSTIADPIHLQSAGTLAQTRITTHAGDYSFTPGVTVNTGQYLTLRVYAWSASAPTKALAIRNVVFSNSTPWPSQQLSPTMATLVQPTSVNLSSEVVTDGGYTVTQTGFAYTTDELFVRYTPGVNDRVAAVNGSSTTGSFTGTFTGLKPATTYWARSYAITENGTSYGKVVQFTTPDSITAKPTVTTNIPATSVGASAATSGGNITNNGGGQIVASGVLYSTTLNTTGTLVLGSGATVTTENVPSGSYPSYLTGLLAGTKYYVRAYASNGDSTGYGAIDSFVTKLIDITTLAATNVTATSAITGGTITPNPINGGTVTASGIIISTVPNPGITDATIIASDSTSGTFEVNLTGLSPNTTYYVTAYVTVNGVTVYGQQTSFTTQAPLPVTLISFKGRSTIDGVVVNWTTTQEYNLSGYYVERGTGNGQFKAVSGLVKPGATTYTFTDKNVPGGTYFYRLRIVDIDGTVKYSNVVIVVVNSRAGFVLTIYPNPTSRTLNVVHQAANNGTTISIATADGKIVIAKTIQTGDTQTTFNVSGLASGMYFVTVNDNNKKSVIKFIKE